MSIIFPSTVAGVLLRPPANGLTVNLATEEDIERLLARSALDPNGPHKTHPLEDWSPIRLDAGGRAWLSILGLYGTENWITSRVQEITPDHSMIRTQNSVYRLGRRHGGEPEVALLMHLSFALLRWRFVAPGDVLTVYY